MSSMPRQPFSARVEWLAEPDRKPGGRFDTMPATPSQHSFQGDGGVDLHTPALRKFSASQAAGSCGSGR